MLEAVHDGLITICYDGSVDSWIRSSIQGCRCFPQKPCFKSYSTDAIMSAWEAKYTNLSRKLYAECDDFLRVYDAVSLYPSSMAKFDYPVGIPYWADGLENRESLDQVRDALNACDENLHIGIVECEITP